MFSDRNAEDHESRSSRTRHSLAAVIQKASEGNFADRKDSGGDLLSSAWLSEIESYSAGLGTALQSGCCERDSEDEQVSQMHDWVLSLISRGILHG